MTMSSDTASLTIKTDSTQVVKGKGDLDNLALSAAQAQSTVDALAKAFSPVASAIDRLTAAIQAGVGQMDKLASAQQQVVAASAKMDVANQRAAKSTEQVGESADDASARIKAMVQASMQKVQAQNASIRAGQRQIQLTDAQRAALDKLNAASNTQAAMNARGAAILADEDRRRATAEASIKAEAEARVKATVSTAASTGAIEANAAAMTINGGVARELGILSGELARGNFSRLEGSIITLTNRAGLMGVVFSSVGLALGAVAATGVTVYEFFEKLQETDKELTTFQQAIALAGNRSEVSAQQLLSLADILGKAKSNTSDYVQILGKIGTSADIPAASLGNVATQIENIAQATGQTSEQVTSEYQKILEDPGKMADELFQKLGVLTPAEYDLVKQLQSSGQAVQAGTTLWNDYVDAVGRAPDALQKAQDALAKTQRAIATYHAAPSSFQFGAGLYGTPSVSASNDPYLANLKQQEQQQATSVAMLKAVDDAQNLLTADQRKAITTAENAGNATDHLRAKLKQLQQQYATLQTVSLDATSKNRLSTNINDEIADVQRQIAQSQKKAAGPDLDSGLPDANTELYKSVMADIKADAQQAAQWAKNTTALNAYKDAMNERLATDKASLQLRIDSIGMGQKEIALQTQLIQIRKEADQQVSQLNSPSNRAHLSQDEYAQRLQAIKDFEQKRVDAAVDADQKITAAQGDWTNGFKSALANYSDQAADVATQTAQLFTNAFTGMSDSLASFVTTGKLNFTSLSQSILSDLIKIETQILVSKALSSIFGSGMTTGQQAQLTSGSDAFIGSVMNAKGNVYTSPSLSAYSNQIVNRPTPFLFASGAGIMGEAGPEAIMPLTRGSNGKLGVQASGGGNVYLTVENNGPATNAKVEQNTAANGDKFIKLILDAAEDRVAKSMATGGKVAKAGQQRYGWQRRGVPVGN